MTSQGDTIVLAMIIIAFVIWAYIILKRWTDRPPLRKMPFISNAAPLSEELKTLLRAHGYTPIGGKLKIPLKITVDGRHLTSRMFIDGFAQKQQELFVVRLHRNRQPIEWTGAGVRNHLLSYALLYEETAGVLYVNEHENDVTEVRFRTEIGHE